MTDFALTLARMGIRDCELNPCSPAVVALANAEAEWLEECYGAIRRVLGERGLA